MHTKKTFLFSPVPGTSHGIFGGFLICWSSEAEPIRSGEKNNDKMCAFLAGLKGNGTLGGIFSAIFKGRGLLRLSVWFPVEQVPKEKGSTLKGGYLLLREQIFFFNSRS